MRKWWWLALLLLAGFAGWLLIQPEPIDVETVVVKQQRVAQTVTNTRSGSVQACRRAKLSLPLGGQIAAIQVAEGDRVAHNALLLSLYNDDIQAQLRQARAQREAAQLTQQRACVIAEAELREASRHQSLLSKKLVSDELADASASRAHASDLDCQRSKAETAQVDAQVQLFEAQLSKTRLHAPFPGTVAEINGEVGEFATPSPPGIPTLPLIDLIDDSCYYVSAPIDEVDAGLLSLGQHVEISIDAYRGQHFDGQIRRIAPYVFALERQARTVDVEIDVLDLNVPLLVGYSADVNIEIKVHDNALAIPSQAIYDGDKVWVVTNGQLELRHVKTGLSNWQLTEILAGISAGEEVVLRAPDQELTPGMPVQTSQARL